MALETGSFFVVIHERSWRSLDRNNTSKNKFNRTKFQKVKPRKNQT
jgi:hypothetical protein